VIAGMDKDGCDIGPKMRGAIWNFSPKLKFHLRSEWSLAVMGAAEPGIFEP
jgi:hypothetical protein